MQECKPVVYQLFIRLFGNKQTVNQPWGEKTLNGVGKFSDVNRHALREIKALGVTHIWYTGVPHHAVIADYHNIGISDDHPAIVKGRAGSPYAVKDYYQVSPDLADDPGQRLQEFIALIERTHACGLKVIMDIVPNHVARYYQGVNNPPGVTDLGAGDDPRQAYHRDNNFYYIPGSDFVPPLLPKRATPLGGEPHPALAQPYTESPAKWTGNGARTAQPGFDDWYETVRINYGIRPDGSKDFAGLPDGYDHQDIAAHAAFWEQQSLPDSWKKLRDIARFWLDQGVDGFRYDVAELVPVEFWSYLNSAIKLHRPDTFLLAEIYQPRLYRDFVHLGKMDYLYDKVGLYDTLRAIICDGADVAGIDTRQAELADIDRHMLRFMENHDEQRIASPEFAADPLRGLPAMLVCATLGCSATLIYFAQEVGEPGAEQAGFGQPSRTSIFDYIGVPHHQRWMNDGAFDGGRLNQQERMLRAFYADLLNYSRQSEALRGDFICLHQPLRQQLGNAAQTVYLFARRSQDKVAIIVANFCAERSYTLKLKLDQALTRRLGLCNPPLMLRDRLGSQARVNITSDGQQAELVLHAVPLAACAFEYECKTRPQDQ